MFAKDNLRFPFYRDFFVSCFCFCFNPNKYQNAFINHFLGKLPNQMLLYVCKETVWSMVTPSGAVNKFWVLGKISKKNVENFVYNFLKLISMRSMI